jgi:hypothetical protein
MERPASVVESATGNSVAQRKAGPFRLYEASGRMKSATRAAVVSSFTIIKRAMIEDAEAVRKQLAADFIDHEMPPGGRLARGRSPVPRPSFIS